MIFLRFPLATGGGVCWIAADMKNTDEIYNGPRRQGPTRIDSSPAEDVSRIMSLSKSVSEACDRFLRSRGLPVGRYGAYLRTDQRGQ